jgi:bacterioferritin
MKGNPKVVAALNEILTGELTSINQYFLHAKMCRNWGFERLAEKDHDESIGEMKHAGEVIERILFLEGVPNLQKLEKVQIGESVPEQLRLDLSLEMTAVERLNKAIALCVEVGDNRSRELLEKILISEEEHVDWLETQLGLVKQLGEAPYLAEQMRK